MSKDLLRMQIRLFRKACKKWEISTKECEEIFTRYDVDDYITDLYEVFHVQSDEANMDDIEEYINNKKEAGEFEKPNLFAN